ncbi:hypothetical protein BGZ83_008479 [Gryganskiella cystojenkinii]|nr:hypothetical protein BGZ83_008479 [Gryganskiella cystojenkinii]
MAWNGAHHNGTGWGDGNGTWPHNNDTDSDGDGSNWHYPGGFGNGGGRPGGNLAMLRSLQPYTSYVVATCWLTFLCAIAIAICIRSMTRLRAWACYITFLGFSIAILGLLRAKFMVSPNWFWAWNFIGESSGVVVIAITIVSVGSGFYPMATNRTLYWRLSQLVIFLYGCMALANAVFYIQQKVIFHPISGSEVQALRDAIIEKGLFTPTELAWQRRLEQAQGLIPPGDATVTGVSSWRELAWEEREMYARPVVWCYLGHQLLTTLTCIWVTFYLFIPLLKHHMKGPMGRPVDSDMMAVGVWYMSCLMTLAAAYMALNLVYCFRHEFIFEQQAQALDLCLRITIAPIYFLPAPAFLIRFYREHFQKFRSSGRSGSGGNNNSGGGGGGGSRTNNNSHFGSVNNHVLSGSFTNSDVGSGGHGRFGTSGSVLHNHLCSSSKTRAGSRLGHGGSSKRRDSLDMDFEDSEDSGDDLRQDTRSPPLRHDHHHPSLSPTSAGKFAPGGSAFKFFQTRDRGQSVESSRGLSRDFEYESSQSHNPSDGGRSDLFFQPGHSQTNSVDLYNMQPLRRSTPLEMTTMTEADIGLHLDGPKGLLPFEVLDSPQIPPAVLSPTYLRSPMDHLRASPNATRPESEFMPSSPTSPASPGQGSEKEQHQRGQKQDDIATFNVNGTAQPIAPTGSTGWEVGSFSNPIPLTISTSTTSSSQQQKQQQQPELNHDPLANVRVEELTGLQRQLAEHRSALLPKVIALKEYHEELATADPLLDDAFTGRLSKPRISNDTILDSKDSSDYYRPLEEVLPIGGRGPPVGHHLHHLHHESRKREQHQKVIKEGGGILAAFSKKLTKRDHNNTSNAGGGPNLGSEAITQERSSESSSGVVDRFSQETKEPTPVEELAAMSTSVESDLHSRRSNHHMSFDFSDPYDLGRSSMTLATTSLASGGFVPSHLSTFTRLQTPAARAEAEAKAAATAPEAASRMSTSKSRESLSSNRPQSPVSKKTSSSKFSTTTGSSGSLSTHSSSGSNNGASAKILRSNIETAFRMSQDSTSPRSPTSASSIADLPRHSTSSSTRHVSPSVDPVKTSSLLPPPRQQQSSWRQSSKSFKGAPVNVNLGLSASNSTPSVSTITTTSSSKDRQDEENHNNDDGEERRAMSLNTASISLSSQISPATAAAADVASKRDPVLQRNHQQQRSIDNLASHYYKRASEISSGTPFASSTLMAPSPLPSPSLSSTPTFAPYQYSPSPSTRIAVPSSLHSPASPIPVLGNNGSNTPPLSPQLKSYGSGVHTMFPTSSSPSSATKDTGIGRNSPSPTGYVRGGSGGSLSTSTTMTNTSAHYGSSFGSSLGGVDSNPGSRSNSFTTAAPTTSSSTVPNRTLMEEDPWTLSMINRAQAQSLSTRSASQKHKGYNNV